MLRTVLGGPRPRSRELQRTIVIETIRCRTIFAGFGKWKNLRRGSRDDEKCESYFRANTSQTAAGRHVVRTGPPIDIGRSLSRAEQILQSIARKLHGSPNIAHEYYEFLHEYETPADIRDAHPPHRSPTLNSHIFRTIPYCGAEAPQHTIDLFSMPRVSP